MKHFSSSYFSIMVSEPILTSVNPHKSLLITAFSDADWGSNPNDKKSTYDSFV